MKITFERTKKMKGLKKEKKVSLQKDRGNIVSAVLFVSSFYGILALLYVSGVNVLLAELFLLLFLFGWVGKLLWSRRGVVPKKKD